MIQTMPKINHKYSPNTQVSTIQLQAIENEFISKMLKLQESSCEFEVKISTFNSLEPIILKCEFVVVDVTPSGKSKFINRKCDMDQISRLIEVYLRTQLKSVPYEKLIFNSNREREETIALINKYANQCTNNAFGLQISVTSIDREHTNYEQSAIQQRINQRSARLELTNHAVQIEVEADRVIASAKLEQLKVLLHKQTELLGKVDAKEELDEVEQQISKIRVSLNSGLTQPNISSTETHGIVASKVRNIFNSIFSS
jgi:hypothetical protein